MQDSIKLSDLEFDWNFSIDEELNQLMQSIQNHGLFHAIIIQGDAPPYKIIAGKKRLMACQALKFERIIATIIPSNATNPQEIALHENLRRHNLPWYEQVELEKELHELRISQHGKKKLGPPSKENTGWSQNDTARELGLALGTLSQDIQLAVALKRNPQLRNIKDKSTALKVIRQIARREQAEQESALPSSIEMDEVYLGDSAVILRTIPDATFDACITDPPWSQYKDESLTSNQESLLPIWNEVYRTLKRDSFLIIITSTTDFRYLSQELPKLGFKVQDYPIIWEKPKTITHGRAPWQFARDYEPIIVAVKGAPSLTSGTEVSSILQFDNLHYSRMIHPHEKPLSLLRRLVSLTTFDGAKVVDPFSGSGATLEACRDLDRRYIGIEKNKGFYDNIIKRMKK
jgi:DNA modification methylase